MTPTKRASLYLCGALGAAMLLPNHSALAVEGGASTYLKGYKDFMSGVVPPEEGWYVRNDLLVYTGDISATVLSGRVSANLSETLVANLTAATYVAPFQVLGATFGAAIAVPIEGVNLTISGTGPRGGRRSISDGDANFGDLLINPIILGWNFGDFHANFAMGFTAPVGKYDVNDLANTGFNRWSFLPQLGFTYFDPKSGWDFSFAPTYDITTKNTATHYQSGDVFHLDWATGMQLSPELKIGITGYWEYQTTPDSGSGAKLGANEASVWALGPMVNYNILVGKTPISLIGKWTHEIDGSHSVTGDTVTMAFALKF
jgi:hypothetical protein